MDAPKLQLLPPSRLLSLSDCDRYIQGQPVIIKVAKRICMPGEEGYVRRALSDRDYDLTSPNPSQASIHMLVDDVLYKIFSYLPIRNLVKCEGGECEGLVGVVACLVY